MRESLAPQTAQAALQRILPHPCKKQYTAVILMPQRSRFGFLSSIFVLRPETRYIHDTKVSLYFLCCVYVFVNVTYQPLIYELCLFGYQILAGIAGLAVLVFGIWRYSRR